MAIKTFEREAKKITSEFTDLIENYDFKEYDFHSIRKTLEDYIKQSYPNYNDYLRSDYIIMLIELFAFYGEMMAYRMDVNMNEAYLSTAKKRKNIVKIADMLGYKYRRLTPSFNITKIDITDATPNGSNFVKKIKTSGSVGDILNKSTKIEFQPTPMNISNYYENKLDYLFDSVSSKDFMTTMTTIYEKLEDFNYTDQVKIKKVEIDGFEVYERSIFVDGFTTRYKPHSSLDVTYVGSKSVFELQSIDIDKVAFFEQEDTTKALFVNDDNIYDEHNTVGFEFVLQYDKGNNILDKNIYMYVASMQGGTFSRPIEVESKKNYKYKIIEQNIFDNKTIIKQFDTNGTMIREYHEVDNLMNHPFKYAYELVNTPDGHVECLFGDGKNSEILLPAATTLFYYRKNPFNTDEVLNIVNGELNTIPLSIPYYDSNVGKEQNTFLNLIPLDRFTSFGGEEAETNEQIKYMSKKLRSIQDRFVTASDYETAALLHPKVKYSTVLLRTFIGKNSPRLSGDFLDVFIDSSKNNIQIFNVQDNIYVYVEGALFTEPSVQNKTDYITFTQTKQQFFFDIFDYQEISPNEWINYPVEILDSKNKGMIIKLTNQKIDTSDIADIFGVYEINNIIPFEQNTKKVIVKNIDAKSIYIVLEVHEPFDDFGTIDSNIIKFKEMIIDKINKTQSLLNVTNFNITQISETSFALNLLYSTDNVLNVNNIDDNTFVWTHYKSDDIYINPSKSNIIEIYVSGAKKNLQSNITEYSPLNNKEINKLVRDINKRKMVSDIIQVYNSSIYSVQIAIKVYKMYNSNIASDLLKTKIDKIIDEFFDLNHLMLGKHFYFSKLIEWIHSKIPEVQHIELITNDNNETITPYSTNTIIGDEINYIQVVEKSDRIIQIIN